GLKRCGEVDAGATGFAGQGIFVGAVREVSRGLPRSKSAAVGVCNRWGGWIQCGDAIDSATCDLFGKDDPAARTGSRCSAGTGVSSIHHSDGASVSFGSLSCWVRGWNPQADFRFGFRARGSRPEQALLFKNLPYFQGKSFRVGILHVCQDDDSGSLIRRDQEVGAGALLAAAVSKDPNAIDG